MLRLLVVICGMIGWIVGHKTSRIKDQGGGEGGAEITELEKNC